jgi:F0F1-type ATP synthase delta subunit
MTEGEILETILKTGFVKSDVHRRIRILRQYLEHTFFGSGEKQELAEFLTGMSVPETDAEIMKSWGDAFYSTFTKENAYDLVDSVGEKVKDLPVVNMYVPIELESDQIVRLGTWFRQNVDGHILVEFHLEHNTIGGCAFAWQGVYQDFSLRHYLHGRNEDIQKIIDGYMSEKK